MFEQLVKEIGRGADVEREVRVMLCRRKLALGVVQGQCAQVVGRKVVGTNHDVSHRLIEGQHTIIIREIGLCREVGWQLEGFLSEFGHRHTVERIGAHAVVCQRNEVPALAVQPEDIGADGLFVALGPKLLIADAQAAVGLDGAKDGLLEFLTCRHVLQHDTVFHRGAIGQHAMHAECGVKPSLDAVVGQNLLIANVILIGSGLAVDDNTEHVDDVITIAIKRGALQWFAVAHVVVLPFLLYVSEGQALVSPEGVDDPDILVEFDCWFHACKDTYK